MNPEAARTMLNAFASVGVETATLVCVAPSGAVIFSLKHIPIERLARNASQYLKAARQASADLHIRPHAEHLSLIQLDDIRPDAFPLRVSGQSLAPFLVIETSPNSFQAWLALRPRVSAEFVRRLREQCGADLGASGSCRLVGSRNYKAKHGPDFPVVRIVSTALGQIAELEGDRELPETRKGKSDCVMGALPIAGRKATAEMWGKWPFRDRAGLLFGDDRSRADFAWCMMALR